MVNRVGTQVIFCAKHFQATDPGRIEQMAPQCGDSSTKPFNSTPAFFCLVLCIFPSYSFNLPYQEQDHVFQLNKILLVLSIFIGNHICEFVQIKTGNLCLHMFLNTNV